MNKTLVYLDNAATTYPKPQGVLNAVQRSFTVFGANAGRGGYKMALDTSNMIYDAREAVAGLFGLKDPLSVAFLQNCTLAINTVIKGVAKQNDHFLISSFEHNAVLRPLYAMKNKGLISYDVFNVNIKNPGKTVLDIKEKIKPETKAIVCTAASNVFGVKLPVEEIGKLAKENGLLLIIDGAQGFGCFEMTAERTNADFLCFSGHKGLYAPMGIGGFIKNSNVFLDTLAEGGTGSNSESPKQPETFPERFESGTLNISGISGVAEGVSFLKKRKEKKEYELCDYLYKELSKNKDVILYTENFSKEGNTPVISFNIDGLDSETSANMFSYYNIATRGGLHCAPLAHKYMNTIDRGTVRVSLSAFTTAYDIERFLKTLKVIIKEK